TSSALMECPRKAVSPPKSYATTRDRDLDSAIRDYLEDVGGGLARCEHLLCGEDRLFFEPEARTAALTFDWR
ncbi:hypothetical protein, partial [Microbacterium sp.]|uniref:hypothetical protein n=1 Tax=Microbacterium sp. TaxID=51671 RepID=UPI003F9A41F7